MIGEPRAGAAQRRHRRRGGIGDEIRAVSVADHGDDNRVRHGVGSLFTGKHWATLGASGLVHFDNSGVNTPCM